MVGRRWLAGPRQKPWFGGFDVVGMSFAKKGALTSKLCVSCVVGCNFKNAIGTKSDVTGRLNLTGGFVFATVAAWPRRAEKAGDRYR